MTNLETMVNEALAQEPAPIIGRGVVGTGTPGKRLKRAWRGGGKLRLKAWARSQESADARDWFRGKKRKPRRLAKDKQGHEVWRRA